MKNLSGLFTLGVELFLDRPPLRLYSYSTLICDLFEATHHMEKREMRPIRIQVMIRVIDGMM